MLGLEDNGAYQDYLKLAKSTRSAMKRLIERKGIAGFSEDAGRVLAGFVYSNARQTSQNMHTGEMVQAANDIPKGMGELKDKATQLVEYIKHPQEEAQKVRGLLFAQYIGGSVASAMVNMTQPFTMTMPWLSQFGGIAKSAKQMTAAVKDATKKTTGDAALDAALKRGEEDGTVSPQEVHDLMRQAQGKGALKSGDGTKLGNATATAQTAVSRIAFAWGKLFSTAEQFNRRVTFIAAYRTAVEQGMSNPDSFARRAIHETQGVYNKGNMPDWARGAVGSTLFTFKQYLV
jgi:tellurite resistance protein